MAQQKDGRDPEIDRFFLAALNAAAEKEGFKILFGDPVDHNGYSTTHLYKKGGDGVVKAIRGGNFETNPRQNKYLISSPGITGPIRLTWNRLAGKPRVKLEGQTYLGNDFWFADEADTTQGLGESVAMANLVESLLFSED